jgi:hypothetical protein
MVEEVNSSMIYLIHCNPCVNATTTKGKKYFKLKAIVSKELHFLPLTKFKFETTLNKREEKTKGL